MSSQWQIPLSQEDHSPQARPTFERPCRPVCLCLVQTCLLPCSSCPSCLLPCVLFWPSPPALSMFLLFHWLPNSVPSCKLRFLFLTAICRTPYPSTPHVCRLACSRFAVAASYFSALSGTLVLILYQYHHLQASVLARQHYLTTLTTWYLRAAPAPSSTASPELVLVPNLGAPGRFTCQEILPAPF